MITCPWCGTSYKSFQSNCGHCGGPLPGPTADRPASATRELSIPPPAPRTVPPRYTWTLWLTSGWAITGAILALLGLIFTLLGTILVLSLVWLFGVGLLIGLPFMAVGVLLLAAGLPLLVWRYGAIQRTMDVLRLGEATLGEVVSVDQNYLVRVNRRHPWVITYRFQTGGREYVSEFTSFSQAIAEVNAGQSIYVLYLPQNPEESLIFPLEGLHQAEYS